VVTDFHFINPIFKILPLIFSLSGVILSLIIYASKGRKGLNIKKKFYIYFFLQNKKFFFDSIYNYISYKILIFSFNTYLIVDRGILEKVGPTSLYKIVAILGYKLRKLQSGYIFHFLFYIVITIIIFILLIII
jgi:NADH-quinone oxidoreductase subunit L